MSLEKYKSQSNLLNDTIKQLSQSKQVGESSFKLDANTSGKLLVKFPVVFSRKPLLNVCVSCESGNELEMRHTVAKLNDSGFELHVLNGDMTNQLSGSIIWVASPSS